MELKSDIINQLLINTSGRGVTETGRGGPRQGQRGGGVTTLDNQSGRYRACVCVWGGMPCLGY